MRISLVRFLTSLNIISHIINLSSLKIIIFIKVIIIEFITIFNNILTAYFYFPEKVNFQENTLYPLFKNWKKTVKMNSYKAIKRKASHILVFEYGQYQGYKFLVVQL